MSVALLARLPSGLLPNSRAALLAASPFAVFAVLLAGCLDASLAASLYFARLFCMMSRRLLIILAGLLAIYACYLFAALLATLLAALTAGGFLVATLLARLLIGLPAGSLMLLAGCLLFCYLTCCVAC